MKTDLSPLDRREKPDVSIIAPCRNERQFIEPFLRSLLAQEGCGLSVEILIADGMSDDGTRDIIRQRSIMDTRIRLIDNPGMIVSAGLNKAIGMAQGDVIIRMDVHTDYATDYVCRCVAALEETAADNVGGPWRAIGRGYFQEAVAIAFQSPFSSGGAGSHRLAYEGPVDTVYLGCWRRKAFDCFGLFDEELVRNQDDEFNFRTLRAGGKIWQSPKIVSWYYPRSSLSRLFAQYSQYGYWKVRVIQKHRQLASWRHMVPAVLVGSLSLTGVLTPFIGWAQTTFFVLFGGYVGTNILAALMACRQEGRYRYLPVMPLIFAAFHFGYGYGFLWGIWDFLVHRRWRNNFARLTRSV